MEKFIKLYSLFLITTLSVYSNHNVAHEPKENSANIILRDGQVEVRIIINLFAWEKVLQDNRAWLIGDTDHVMPSGLNTKKKDEYLKSLLKNKTHISINGKPVPLANARIIKPENNHHAHEIEIVLTGKHTFASPEKVSIELPKSLGTVHARFVKPVYTVLKPGKRVTASLIKSNNTN